jgi:hypothetical protein
LEILIIISVLISGGLLNFIIKPAAKSVYYLAVAYTILALLVATGDGLLNFGIIKNAAIINRLILLLHWSRLLGYLMLGYLMINILIALTAADTAEDSYHLKKNVDSTLRAVTILTSLSFIIASYWKVEHFCKMTFFFTSSGYTVWFLYVIVAAEALGGLGMILHFKFKTGPAAAAGLMLIMIGVLYTYNHNKAPFAESYAAISQLITLFIMEVIYYFSMRLNALSTPQLNQSR